MLFNLRVGNYVITFFKLLANFVNNLAIYGWYIYHEKFKICKCLSIIQKLILYKK